MRPSFPDQPTFGGALAIFVHFDEVSILGDDLRNEPVVGEIERRRVQIQSTTRLLSVCRFVFDARAALRANLIQSECERKPGQRLSKPGQRLSMHLLSGHTLGAIALSPQAAKRWHVR